MRKIPDPPAGSGQWRDGWQNGYEQALINAERAERHDGPRTWAIECPPAPRTGTRVINGAHIPFVIREDGRVESEGMDWSWEGALKRYGPFTEVVETEVEAAARRLREHGVDDVIMIGALGKDARTVLAHVLNGGQL